VLLSAPQTSERVGAEGPTWFTGAKTSTEIALWVVNPINYVVRVFLRPTRRVDERLYGVRAERHACLLSERTNCVRAICREVTLEGATRCVNVVAIDKSADAPVVVRRPVAAQLNMLLEPDRATVWSPARDRSRRVDGLVAGANGDTVIVAPVEERCIQDVLTARERGR